MRSPCSGMVRRRAAKPMAYMAISMLEEPRSDGSAMSGSWPPELRSARAWIVAQSSRGRPSNSPTTAPGSWAHTSWTNSTSTPAPAATREWIGSRMPAVMARMRSSMRPITLALNSGATGLR